MLFDRLWRARRQRNGLEKSFERAIARADKAKDKDRSDALARLFFDERERARENISILESTILFDKAEDLGVPAPLGPGDDPGSWELSRETNRAFLNPHARAQLRSEIFKARRERVQDRMLWVSQISPLIGPITGLIGALAALFSIIYARFR
ncbi:MAG: hypothetical protein HY046_03120 [Acidobacteria bacterium]|nr:hypothetical protein [Acidobacteriota bacterium]